MPNSVDISKKEWSIVRSLRDEFRDAVKENDAAKFDSFYKDAVQHDEAGNMLVRRIRSSESFDSQRSGISGLEHSFIVTPQDDVIGFGRSNVSEDSVLGQGSFGRVREAKMKSSIDKLDAEAEAVAVKVLISGKEKPSADVEHEVEMLQELGQLKAHMNAEVKCKGKPVNKSYIVVDLAPGQNLREIARPEITLSKVLRPLLLRERQEGTQQNDDSLHQALVAYQQGAKNPLSWKTEKQPLSGKGYIEPMQRFWREFLRRPSPKLPEHAIKLGRHVSSIIRLNQELRLAGESALPYLQRVEYAIAATQALQELHSKGIIHRDIKGLNFVGEQRYINGSIVTSVRIVDLALAVPVNRKDKPEHIRREFVGTEAYASPELLNNMTSPDINERYSFKTDIFALGKTFKLDLQLQQDPLGEEIIEKLTAVEPDQRPDLDTVLGLLLELKNYLSEAEEQHLESSPSM